MDLARLATALEIAGSVDPGALYVHHLQILLTIREAGPAGCSYRTIEERHGLSNASASRSLNALSDQARHRKTSMGLIEIRRDPTEGRRYVAVLSKKGEALLRSIEQV